VSAHGEAAEAGEVLRAVPAPAASRARAVLGAASAIHFVHDGFSDVIYVLLPVWASQFGLTFAQVGLLRTVYSAGMAAFQIPAGILAERWGEARLLATGTAVTAIGFLAAGAKRRKATKPVAADLQKLVGGKAK